MNLESLWYAMKLWRCFGRTGKLFAFENFDVVPDLVTFAKGVTRGYVPLGGVAVSKKDCRVFSTTTYYPVA